MTSSIFDRLWFNRVYFTWFTEVYKYNVKMAESIDKKIIGSFGTRMANELREKCPRKHNELMLAYIERLLRKSHWGQERIERFSLSKNTLILYTPKTCEFQLQWKIRCGSDCRCHQSHILFLRNFVKVFGKYKVRRLKGNTISCAWKIIKEE